MNKVLKSYFFWTYPRGNFHYDVMVTLILAFIFVTPHLWDYGDKPVQSVHLSDPIQVTRSANNTLLITVSARDVPVTADMSEKAVRKVLHQAIEPVTGDAVAVVKWDTISDANGKPTAWRVTAHR
jgi:hypothetical protein